MNFNDLPCDIMTKIMNINKEAERREKQEEYRRRYINDDDEQYWFESRYENLEPHEDDYDWGYEPPWV